MRLLDLFCGAGGAAVGYQRAGFDEIVGVDIEPQKNYPFEFVQADAMTYSLDGFDAIHASPPCQAYSHAAARWRVIGDSSYPALLEATRQRLAACGTPYIIENVVAAPMPGSVTLCGLMFGLRVLRHRQFWSSEPLSAPAHQPHEQPIWGDHYRIEGQRVRRSVYVTVAGHGGNSSTYRLKDWSEAMGIDWMTRAELIESIPPAYTEHLGRLLLQPLTARML